MKRRSTHSIRVGLLAVAVGLSADFAAAEDGAIRWKKDLQAAAAESERVNKPMLLKFTASWCGPCRRMSRLTFRDAEVARHVNGCFIPVAVDVDQHQELVKAAGVNVYPTTVIVSPKFEVIQRIAGYQSPAQLRRHLGGLCRVAEHKVAPSPKTKPAQPDKRAEVAVASREPQPESKPVETVKAAPPAFDGRCLVSMLEDRKVRSGQSEHTLVFRGRTLRFHTAEYKRRFQAAPEKYWPVLGGACPVELSASGKSVEGDPRYAVIYQKRLWFFTGAEQRMKFAKQPGEFHPDRN